MCLASKYMDNLQEGIKQIQKGFEELDQLRSKYDKEVNSIYHKIETTRFNASEGYYLSKNLQEVLQKRRIVKEEMAKLNSLIDSTEYQSIQNSINGIRGRVNGIERKRKSKEYMKNFNFTLNDVHADTELH